MKENVPYSFFYNLKPRKDHLLNGLVHIMFHFLSQINQFEKIIHILTNKLS